MSNLQIATVGDDTEPILVGVRQFSAARLVLIHPPRHEERARSLKQLLRGFRLDVQLQQVADETPMDVLAAVARAAREGATAYEEVYINASSGDATTTAGALAAAFLGGVEAFTVREDQVHMVPSLRIAFQDLVSGTKVDILAALKDHGGAAESLHHLSKLSGLDKPLLSYHLRTDSGHGGLQDLGLVTLERGDHGRLEVRLTPLGDLVVEGHRQATVAPSA